MLEIIIPEYEVFDERDETFIIYEETTLKMEHSLISVAKWESKWHKPFLSKTPKEPEEINDYIKCMTINRNVPDSTFQMITRDQYTMINDYMANPMTATTFSETTKGSGGEIMTAELIYYYMIANSIPVEFEKWHINRLLTLIRVCNIKSQTPKKKSNNEILRNNAALNAARRRKLNTKG